MTLKQLHDQLSQSWIEMNRNFTRSHEEWDDMVLVQFERDYWHGLQAGMSPHLQSLKDLATTVQQARRFVK